MARKYRNFVYDENQRFIYPTSDWGFKYLLGSEENKDILLELLNRLFPDYHIESLEYLPFDHLHRCSDSGPLCQFQDQRLLYRQDHIPGLCRRSAFQECRKDTYKARLV